MDQLATHFNRRLNREQELRVPCPAHRGEHDNLALWADPAKHRISAHCFSHGCDYKAIAQAIEEEAGVKLGSGLTRNVKRIFPYTDGNTVTRTDKHTGDYAGKRMKQTTGSTAEGAPLYVGKPAGDPKTLTMVFVEGEGDVDRLASLGYRAITWRGGALALRNSTPDLSILKGYDYPCALWPDDNQVGIQAMMRMGQLLQGIARSIVWAMPADYTGDTGLDTGDYDSVAIAEVLAAATPYEPKPEPEEPPPERERANPTAKDRVQVALKLWQTAFRYNLRGNRVEYRNGSGKWQEEDTLHNAVIRDRLVAAYGKQGFGREAFKDSVDAICYDNQVDPFLEYLEYLEYLESLPDWDGTPRLDGLLHSLFVVAVNNPPGLVAWVGQFLFVGPVYRTYHPGAKLDEIPVLIGGQGMGKSTALRKLLPPWGADDWFADGLSLAATDKEVGEVVENRVIVEISEMGGIRRADLERLKSWISRTNDGYFRRAYARYAVSSPRRCVIVGTTNTPDCLPNDPTGNRRFVPVTLVDGSPADVREYLDSNREQLWAEGLHRYQAGEHPRLPDNLKVIQTAHNERHRDRDTSMEDALTTWLDANPADSYTLAAIAQGVGLLGSWDTGAKLPRADQNRLSTALRAAGFENQRRWDGSKKVWSWARI